MRTNLWLGLFALGWLASSAAAQNSYPGAAAPRPLGDRLPRVPWGWDDPLACAPLAEDTAAGAADSLPGDAHAVLQKFQAEEAAIKKEAEQRIQGQREKLIDELQAMQDKYAGDAKLEEAVAIRELIRALKAAVGQIPPSPTSGKEQHKSAVSQGPGWPADAPPPAIAPFAAEQAKKHQAAWAQYLGVPVESENSIGMKFVLIPPGEFDMGSTEADLAKLLEEATAKKREAWYLQRLPDEAPQHRARITKPFWLSRHEVTRGQFRRFVDDRKYQTEAERDGKGGFGIINGQWVQDPRFVWNADRGFEQADDHPVVNVCWNDVTAYCEWLSEQEGVKCHPPTEAQWEYACRAGTTTSWHGGDNETALPQDVWFSVNSGNRSHPVGQLRPNAWGLYDMHGNVWEWCQDWWDPRYYAVSPLDDPTGPSGGSIRVRRGGGWWAAASDCRASYRSWYGPGLRGDDLGFRVARTVSQDSNRVKTER